jgi:hypothetical protein
MFCCAILREMESTDTVSPVLVAVPVCGIERSPARHSLEARADRAGILYVRCRLRAKTKGSLTLGLLNWSNLVEELHGWKMSGHPQ